MTLYIERSAAASSAGTVARERGAADAGRHRAVRQLGNGRLVELRFEAFDERADTGRIVGFRQRGDKFVAAQPRDKIGCARCELYRSSATHTIY